MFHKLVSTARSNNWSWVRQGFLRRSISRTKTRYIIVEYYKYGFSAAPLLLFIKWLWSNHLVLSGAMVTLEGIVLWNNQPDREAFGLVRKGVGQSTVLRAVETPYPKVNPIQFNPIQMIKKLLLKS